MVSVIMCIYNKEEYLCRSLPSILNQTYQDYEIILVDDGSTDRSSEICDSFEKNYEKVHVFHKQNGGLPSALNCGLDNAKGDFVAFVDPDDWVEPEYLELMMSAHEKYGTDLEICGFFRVQNEKETAANESGSLCLLNQDQTLSMLFGGRYFCTYYWNKFFHMNIIQEHHLRFDDSLKAGQDILFTYQYISHCKTIVYDPRPMYHYDTCSGMCSMRVPFGERRMTVFGAYTKVASLAEARHPEVRKKALSSLVFWSLTFIYTYFYTGMKEPEKLEMLRMNVKKYSSFFIADKQFSWMHKSIVPIALINPYLYFFCMRIKRCVSGQDYWKPIKK